MMSGDPGSLEPDIAIALASQDHDLSVNRMIFVTEPDSESAHRLSPLEKLQFFCSCSRTKVTLCTVCPLKKKGRVSARPLQRSDLFILLILLLQIVILPHPFDRVDMGFEHPVVRFLLGGAVDKLLEIGFQEPFHHLPVHDHEIDHGP